MKQKLVQKLIAVTVMMPSIIFSTLAMPGNFAANAATADPTCSTITLVSGSGSQTAGFTETDPLSAPASLQPALYSGGALTGALATQTVIPPWIDPATDSNFSTSSAIWISTDSTWPGGNGNTEGSAVNDQWRLFNDSFTLPANATVNSAQVFYTADNAAEVYLNGVSIGTTNDVYGPAPAGNPANYSQVFNAPFAPVAGSNSLDFVIRNWNTDSDTNPTGLLYKAVVDYCVPGVNPAPEQVKVTIVKFVNGSMATASSSNSNDFPMSATWDATNIGAGTGQYVLSASGFNGDPTPYQAITSEMTSGANYATNEITGGEVVGVACSSSSQPYALVGYTTGDTIADAASSTPTLAPPSFVNLTNDKAVIVWNMSCVGSNGGGTIGGTVTSTDNGVLQVTSIDMTKTTSSADGTFEGGWKYVFNITAPKNESHLAMKFVNWLEAASSSTIPVANNMRISSAQADNAGATILLTAANTYSSPSLHMTSDLNSSLAGNQVQVTVELRVPVGTPNGSYSTSYGVQTLP